MCYSAIFSPDTFLLICALLLVTSYKIKLMGNNITIITNNIINNKILIIEYYAIFLVNFSICCFDLSLKRTTAF